MDSRTLGILLVAIGVVVASGVLLLAFGKLPPLGRLPGNIIIRREGFTFYLPVVTMLLASVILTVNRDPGIAGPPAFPSRPPPLRPALKRPQPRRYDGIVVATLASPLFQCCVTFETTG